MDSREKSSLSSHRNNHQSRLKSAILTYRDTDCELGGILNRFSQQGASNVDVTYLLTYLLHLRAATISYAFTNASAELNYH